MRFSLWPNSMCGHGSRVKLVAFHLLLSNGVWIQRLVWSQLKGKGVGGWSQWEEAPEDSVGMCAFLLIDLLFCICCLMFLVWVLLALVLANKGVWCLLEVFEVDFGVLKERSIGVYIISLCFTLSYLDEGILFVLCAFLLIGLWFCIWCLMLLVWVLLTLVKFNYTQIDQIDCKYNS